MSQTAIYETLHDDCDFPLKLTWELEYIVHHRRLSIIGKRVLNAWSQVFPEVWYPLGLTLRDVFGEDLLNWRFGKRLQNDLLEQACWDHYESLDEEGRRLR